MLSNHFPVPLVTTDPFLVNIALPKNYSLKKQLIRCSEGFPSGSDGKESACNAGDTGLICWSGRYSGEGNGNLLQYSCLENSMDRGAWRATVRGVAKRHRLSD